MRPGADGHGSQASVTLDLPLSHGRQGASAHVAWFERPDSPPGAQRIAVVALRGWLDRVAVTRLEAALQDLAARGVDQVLLDCSLLRHIDHRLAPDLVDRLERFESRESGVVVCGLSRHLRDLFRLSGCDDRLRCWPSAAELLDAPATRWETSGERAS
jgi:anti-anti-sigma factor